MNSSGSAIAENEKWLDSIEGKTYKFTNALQKMWNNLLNSEVIKGFLDFGTGAIEVLDTSAGKVIALVAALKLMAKFKGFSLGGVVQGLGDTINSITTAQQTLQTLVSNPATKIGQGFDLTNITAYAQAVQNLTAKQQANLLASQGLNQEQIRHALTLNQVSDAAMREAMAHVHATSAKQQENIVGAQGLQQKAQALAMSLRTRAATEDETRAKELNIVADILENSTSEEAIRNNLQEAVTSKGVSASLVAETTSTLGLTAAKTGLLAVTKALMTANPIGFWITVGSTILSLIPIVSNVVDAFTKSADEIKKEAEEIGQAYTDAVNDVNNNLQSLGVANDDVSIAVLEKEFATLTAGVDKYGNNLSLTSDQYERYKEICEQIVDINPLIASGYDSATEAIGNNASVLSQLIELQREQARIAAAEYVNDENLEILSEDAVNDYLKAWQKNNDSTAKAVTTLTKSFDSAFADYISTTPGIENTIAEKYKWILTTIGYEADKAAKISDSYKIDHGDGLVTYSTDFYTDYADEIKANLSNFKTQYTKDISDAFVDVESEFKAAEERLAEARDGLIDNLLVVPVSSGDYNELTSEGKNFLIDWIKNSEIFKIQDGTLGEEEVQAMRDTILDMMDVIVSDTKSIEYNGEKFTTQELISKFYDFDLSSISYKDYKQQIKEILAALWSSLTDGQKKEYGFDKLEDFEIALGFDFVAENEPGTKMVKRYAEIKGITEDEAKKYFTSLPAITVQRLLTVDWNTVDDTNVDETIAGAQSNQQSIVSSKTYSVLVESIETYNDIVAQTSEIVSDNTEITQEYKDALLELGIAEEDLAEYFDDNNGLIVTNAKGLNKLVKSTSKSVANNVKLAKSQARLDYYRLVKQLNEAMSSTIKLDDATRDSIYTTLDQIDSVEQAIYKYKLLEDSLLGATNAFNDFSKAQEIDELNTYGDSYVEMVQTLYDGLYKTGQVGTEQFKAAREALIPDDIYKGLVDENERMEATVNYFNKHIAPTLTLKDDEFKFDYDGVENFVQNLLDAGVAIGDIENFDLVEGMNLKEAAKLLKDIGKPYSETALYANFAELDKYNTGTEQSFLSQLDDSLEGRINNITSSLQDLNEQKLVFLEDKSEIAYELEKLGAGGAVDLTIRPVIDSQELIDAGWKTQAGQIATVFTSTFSNEAGNIAINFTPIVVDELGNRIDVLGPKELQQYAEDVIAGVREDDLHLQIGSVFEGDNAIAQAEKAAETIHNLHEDYVSLDETIGEINTDIADNNAKLIEIGKSAYEMWQAYEQNEAALASLEEISDKQMALTKDEAQTLGVKWDEEKGLTVQEAYDQLLLKKAKLEEPTVVTAQLSIEYIDKQIADLEYKIEKIKHDTEISPEVKEADISKLNEQINKLKQNKVVLATEFGIELTEEEKATLQEELSAIEQFTINDKTFTVVANGTSDVMKNLEDIRDFSLKDKTFRTTNYETTYKRTKKQTWNPVTAQWEFASVNGTAHANGNWGAPKTETALVGELGPELIVDPKTSSWHTVGDNGAEFTQVKRGQIIFNHKQTEQLLKNGYVAGRGKLHGGAFASGTAYAGIWKPLSPDKELSNKAGRDFSYAASNLNNASGSISDAEEITEDLDLKGAQLENKIGYTNQNKIIDDMIDLNQKLYDNLIAGANKYYAYAEKLLAKIPSTYRKAAQDGSIAIEEFVGEVDEKTLEAIQEYRDWVQKGADATQQAEETLTEISALAKQAIDNISQDFENKTSLNSNKIDQLEAYNALLETDQGFESEKVYQAIISANNANIDQLKKQRKEMQTELDAQVKAGNIKKYSQDWYDAVNDIAAVDTEIIELTTDTKEYQDTINELYWDKFDALIGRIEAVSDEAENLIDILSNKDLIDEDGNWTDDGITSLGLYAQQLEASEVQAKKYQEEIANLNKNWQKLGYTEEEYIEKLNELKDGQYDAIKAYHDTKDAIVDLNKERVDAIKNGIEKEIEAYEELIEKKKEELDSEKDIYDFQKNVSEKQKNISDIERRLAALSSDNSASARAQRAKLQAELAEAQAELQDLYYDRSISDQQDALDKELENFRDEKDKELEGWDEYLENTEQVVSESLQTVQNNTGAVYQTLIDMGKEYGLSITESLTSPWKEGESAIQSFSDQFGISMSATVEELEELELHFKETMLEIEQAGKEAVNTVSDNASRYTSAEKKTEKAEANNGSKSNSNSNSSNSNNAQEKTIKVGGKIDAKGAKIYGSMGAKSGSKQYYANDPIYQVLDINGNWIKVRHHKAKSGTTGWFKKADVKAYASGTTGVNKDQIALIDELGEELVLRAHNGRLTYMEKGTAVIPSDITSNLMQLGQLDPSMILDQNRPAVSAPHIANNETIINIEYGDVLHIDHFDGNNPGELSKLIDKAFDKHMKNLNQQIRRYTR